MTLVRLFLIAFVLVLSGYTLVVIGNYGLNLFPYFFGDMMALTWAGQFNLDFMGFLMLSAVWTAWRNDFSGSGLALAVVAFFGGMAFLGIYLTYLSFRCEGKIESMLLGEARAQGMD